MRAWFTAVLTPIIVFLKMWINPKLELTHTSDHAGKGRVGQKNNASGVLVAVLRWLSFHAAIIF